jgi:hypothetical protein
MAGAGGGGGDAGTPRCIVRRTVRSYLMTPDRRYPMDNAPLTDDALEAMRLRVMHSSVLSYSHIVPVLIEEILRLRQVVRGLAIERATHDAAR